MHTQPGVTCLVAVVVVNPSLGGSILGRIGFGGPSTGPTPFSIVVVSRCRFLPAAVVGRGCKLLRRGELISIIRVEEEDPLGLTLTLTQLKETELALIHVGTCLA